MLRKLLKLIFSGLKKMIQESMQNGQTSVGDTKIVEQEIPSTKVDLIEPESDDENGQLCLIQCLIGDYEHLQVARTWREPTEWEAIQIVEKRTANNLRKVFSGEITITNIDWGDGGLEERE